MTRSVSLVLAAVLGGVLVGGIVWFAKPAAPVASSTPPPSSVSAPVSAATARTPSMAAGGAAQTQAPPWAGAVDGSAGNLQPMGMAAAIHAAPVDPAKAKARAAIRARLAELTAGGRHPTPGEMSGVLADLERTEGSSAVGGVNIEALRNNLDKVSEMQKLGAELSAEAQQPGGGDKQKIEQILSRVRQLQSEMQSNIIVASPAPGQQK